MKKILAIIISLLFVSTFSLFILFRLIETEFKEIKYKNEFALPIPSFLTKSDNLDTTAIAQYACLDKNLFVLIYKHKADSLLLSEYFKQLSSKLCANIGRGTLLKYYPDTICGNKAFVGNVRGYVNERMIYYRITLIEAGGFYYEIIWGVDEDIRSSYEEDIDKMIKGFRIIKS